jgi:hypothetical protein
MTWVLNNCRGSTLLAILFHAAFDSSGLALITLFPSTSPYYLPVHYQTLGIAIFFSIVALVLILVTRGDLSSSVTSGRWANRNYDTLHRKGVEFENIGGVTCR